MKQVENMGTCAKFVCRALLLLSVVIGLSDEVNGYGEEEDEGRFGGPNGWRFNDDYCRGWRGCGSFYGQGGRGVGAAGGGGGGGDSGGSGHGEGFGAGIGVGGSVGGIAGGG